jgi:hypothetical protein
MGTSLLSKEPKNTAVSASDDVILLRHRRNPQESFLIKGEQSA